MEPQLPQESLQPAKGKRHGDQTSGIFPVIFFWGGGGALIQLEALRGQKGCEEAFKDNTLKDEGFTSKIQVF